MKINSIMIDPQANYLSAKIIKPFSIIIWRNTRNFIPICCDRFI